MSEELESGALRLHSGAPWWLLQNGLAELSAPIRGPVDVAIVGAGVTGALVADSLSSEGARVALIDRRTPGTGSTSVSTGLLQYEIDTPLSTLVDQIGATEAVEAYRWSWDSIDRIESIAACLPDAAGFERKPSLYLASRRRALGELDREQEIRELHGFVSERLTRSDVLDRYGILSRGALQTSQSGQVDPVLLTRGLLARAIGRGAALLANTAVHDIRHGAGRFVLDTSRGEVTAGQVVFAMGYEMPPRMLPDLVKLHSTFALVTEPAEDLGRWGGRCLLWETNRPYTYLRTTRDGRIICGGEDLPFKNPDARDALVAPRARRLEKRLSKLLPGMGLRTAFTWSGTFAETRDGLPLIGPSSELHGAFVALGYGGNGITFGIIAADILCCLLRGQAPPREIRMFDPAR
ncbi:MAG TPA: FAD-dependent oxidoreductase [Gemmatimonadales bacterium]|nr:FAD-dependent oxidoreductase [Gemmatimonadales bacterium]